jgi:exopolyphosphatase / guanosine-5'-triphosphate,3'-diphosphate pyrophosphatase
VIKASIDLGTSTCLLLIAECDPETGRVHRIVSDHSTVVRLGEGVDRARELQPRAMERTLACLKVYWGIVVKAGLNPKDTICVATSSSRDSKNGQSFFSQVEKETGFRFRVISGEDEAKYTFQGALLPETNSTDSAVIDIGGGSTEFIATGPGISLDIGSVRFTERFFKNDRKTPISDEEFWACQDAIDAALSEALDWRKKNPQIKNLLAVAGTATTLAAWHLEMRIFDAARLDACVLTRGDIHRMVEELKWRTVEERALLPGIARGREDVLLAGALILWRAMEILNFPEAQISTRGLRFGIMALGSY